MNLAPCLRSVLRTVLEATGRLSWDSLSILKVLRRPLTSLLLNVQVMFCGWEPISTKVGSNGRGTPSSHDLVHAYPLLCLLTYYISDSFSFPITSFTLFEKEDSNLSNCCLSNLEFLYLALFVVFRVEKNEEARALEEHDFVP